MLRGEGWLPPVFAQWQWGSAGMLAFGLAVVIPLLLHLWARQPRRVQPWAAMRFLQAALQKTARRRRLTTWLLLLLRCGLLAAWAVALAAPRWYAAQPTPSLVAAPSHVCLVLDRSFSMQYQTDGRSHFQQAVALAKAKVHSAAEGTLFTLVAMDQPPQAIIAQPTPNRDAVLVELERMEAGQSPASLSATLALVLEIVREAALPPKAPLAQQVCLYSDLQQLPWGQLRAAAVQSLLASVKEQASVELIDLGPPQPANRAVVHVECDPTLAVVGQPVQLTAEIRNFGREACLRQEVTLWVDQQPAGQQLVDLPPGGSARVVLTHRFAQAGDRIVEFRLADDALAVDDRRWLCVPVRRALRVLCVGQRPDDTRYLALALSPQLQETTGFDVVQRRQVPVPPDDWQAYDAVILSNVAAPADLPGLWRYVREGGGLIVFLGDRVQPEQYEPALTFDPPLLPARPRGPSVEGEFRIRPRLEQHPIVAPFRGLPQSGLLTTPVWRYLPLEPLPQAVTVAEFNSGAPAIVAAEVGQGRCVLVATAATWPTSPQQDSSGRPWTALPTWPSFPPLVHEMVRYVLAAQAQRQSVLVGQALVDTLSAPRGAPRLENLSLVAAGHGGAQGRAASPQLFVERDSRGAADQERPQRKVPVLSASQARDNSGATAGFPSTGVSPADEAVSGSVSFPPLVQLTGPGGLAWNIPATVKGTQASLTSVPLPRAGVYEARWGNAHKRYVANIDPAESDLSRVDPAFLEGLLGRPSPVPVARAPATARAWDLAWPLLVLVLLILVAEPYLAGWLSGRRS